MVRYSYVTRPSKHPKKQGLVQMPVKRAAVKTAPVSAYLGPGVQADFEAYQRKISSRIRHFRLTPEVAARIHSYCRNKKLEAQTADDVAAKGLAANEFC
jgi:hypothetical protein